MKDYCANFYTNISTIMDTTNIFPFLEIFFHKILTIEPPK